MLTCGSKTDELIFDLLLDLPSFFHLLFYSLIFKHHHKKSEDFSQTYI